MSAEIIAVRARHTVIVPVEQAIVRVRVVTTTDDTQSKPREVVPICPMIVCHCLGKTLRYCLIQSSFQNQMSWFLFYKGAPLTTPLKGVSKVGRDNCRTRSTHCSSTSRTSHRPSTRRYDHGRPYNCPKQVQHNHRSMCYMSHLKYSI